MTDRPDEGKYTEAAVGDPAGYYNDPQAVMADKTLTKAQKRRFLDGFAHDLRRLGAAGTHDDAERLAQVETLRSELGSI